MHEPSQEDDDAFAQPHHSEHKHQDKRIEREFLAQQEHHATSTRQRSQHEKHEWVKRTEYEPWQQNAYK